MRSTIGGAGTGSGVTGIGLSSTGRCATVDGAGPPVTTVPDARSAATSFANFSTFAAFVHLAMNVLAEAGERSPQFDYLSFQNTSPVKEDCHSE